MGVDEEQVMIHLSGDWNSVLGGTHREQLEQELPAFLKSQRWFGGKARKIDSVRIVDSAPLPTERAAPAFLLLLDVRFENGAADSYSLPLAVSSGLAAARFEHQLRTDRLATLAGPHGEAVLHDGLADDDVCLALLTLIGDGQEIALSSGVIRGTATSAYSELRGDRQQRPSVTRGAATSSNSLVFYGRRLLLKLFRRLEPGINPDYEIGRFLTERTSFDRLPLVAGCFEYLRDDGNTYTLGILQALVPNEGDGWEHALDELRDSYARATAEPQSPDRSIADRPLRELCTETPPEFIRKTIGESNFHAATILGRRTAEMHLALSSDDTHPDFAPEPLDRGDVAALQEEIAGQARQAFSTLADNADQLDPQTQSEARRLLDAGPAALQERTREWSAVPSATKTRIHGDYHLGQLLWVGNDYVIIDFEGEPTRSVDERRRKFSPLRDVAGMLRSYHYAAYAALFEATPDAPEQFERLAPWAETWRQWISAAFLREYLHVAGDAAFVPRDPSERADLLDALSLAKAFYELTYELNNRPDWVRIPLGGVLASLGMK